MNDHRFDEGGPREGRIPLTSRSQVFDDLYVAAHVEVPHHRAPAFQRIGAEATRLLLGRAIGDANPTTEIRVPGRDRLQGIGGLSRDECEPDASQSSSLRPARGRWSPSRTTSPIASSSE